ncbi:SGNH/GDSL hydrolase family protein [Microbacterium hydrocarbonoxydans]|uniref:SGNH/GDSL hydrolase family protein n=1 Tax=Microbacterium hydrocarbonoxydans TaxID=273678 RepID=UPI0007BC10A3|nr:SGNH/GDSL hydrolase family protein [Microbacterium hydrocarbonoxydans]GAT71551.1 GDSL-like protein [Microbacterium sp. HM58-2]
MTPATRIVFIGDSITDAGRDREDPASLGDGYVSLLAPELTAGGATVRNLGIAGNRAVDLAARWDDELMPTEPDLLTVYVGVNDMWRRFDRDDPTSAEDFEARLRPLLERVVAVHRPRLVLMEPFFLPVVPEQTAWLEDLDGKRAVVRALAAEFGAELVPLHEVFTAAAAEHPVAALAPDGVHPTPLGSRLIADAWRAAAFISDSR